MIGAFILLFLPGSISARLHNMRRKADASLSYVTLWAVYSFIIDWLLCFVKMIRGHAAPSVQESFSSVGTIVKYGVLAGGLAVILPFIWQCLRKASIVYKKIDGQASLDSQNSKEENHSDTSYIKQILLSLLFIIPAIILAVIICANN